MVQISGVVLRSSMFSRPFVKSRLVFLGIYGNVTLEFRKKV